MKIWIPKGKPEALTIVIVYGPNEDARLDEKNKLLITMEEDSRIWHDYNMIMNKTQFEQKTIIK